MRAPAPTSTRAYRTRATAALAVALTCGVTAAGYAQVSQSLRAPEWPGAAASRSQPRAIMQISGSAQNLYPGARRRLRIVLRNRTGRRFAVASLSVRVAAASRRCAARYLAVDRPRGRLVLRPHGRSGVWTTVRMRPTAPDGCKHARFPLRIQARLVAR